MILDFSYGDKLVNVRILDGALIKKLMMKRIPPAENAIDLIRHAIENPINSQRLKDLGRGRKNAVIMVPDRTRKVPLNEILPLTIEEILKAGIRKGDISILIGSGTHREMTEDEINEHFGIEIASEYRIYNHIWWDKSQLNYIGTTKNETPIEINKIVCNADLKVAVGSVKPHRDAGWSGGAKMIQPGVSGLSTTGYTHWLAAQYSVEEILGKTDNPVRREMEEIAGRVGLDFIVNCVLNEDYEIVSVFAGHYIDAHRACVDAARPFFTVKISEKADVLIAGSSASLSNMWANGTGPNWGELVLKDGGTVILFAQCKDGVSNEHPEVLENGYLPLNKVKDLVEKGEIKDLAAASHICHGGEKLYKKNIRCILVSEGVSREEARQLGLEYARTPQEAVDMAMKRYGENVRIYAYPGHTYAELIIETG